MSSVYMVGVRENFELFRSEDGFTLGARQGG